VYTNTLGEQVTVTEILSNPSLLPGDHGGGASAFFHMRGAVIAVFTAIGLVVVAGSLLLFWYLRSRHKRRKMEHDNVVATILDGRRDSARLSLIDDDEDDSGNGHPGLTHSHSNSSTTGRMSPIDSAGQTTSNAIFPPVSLLAASYNRRKSSASQGQGRSGGGRYQHLPTNSGGGRRSPSPPPQFTQEDYRDPFAGSPSVPFLLGSKGGDRSPPTPAIMDEFDPAPLTFTHPISPDEERRGLIAHRKEFGSYNPASSTESLPTGASTPRDWEVRNVFDEELGSVPKMRRKPMLSVQNPSLAGSSPAPSIR